MAPTDISGSVFILPIHSSPPPVFHFPYCLSPFIGVGLPKSLQGIYTKESFKRFCFREGIYVLDTEEDTEHEEDEDDKEDEKDKEEAEEAGEPEVRRMRND